MAESWRVTASIKPINLHHSSPTLKDCAGKRGLECGYYSVSGFKNQTPGIGLRRDITASAVSLVYHILPLSVTTATTYGHGLKKTEEKGAGKRCLESNSQQRFTATTELRSCVKVEVAVLVSRP